MLMIGAIGPKVSCGDRDRVRRHLGRARSAPSRGWWGSRRRGSRRSPRVAPRSTASATCSSIFAAPGSLLTGPIVVASSNGSPSRTSRSTSPASSVDELLAHRLVHEQPLGRGAALAGAEEAADARGVGRRGEVGVVHHDERPVAAHLEQLRLARRLARDDQAGLRSSR